MAQIVNPATTAVTANTGEEKSQRFPQM